MLQVRTQGLRPVSDRPARRRKYTPSGNHLAILNPLTTGVRKEGGGNMPPPPPVRVENVKSGLNSALELWLPLPPFRVMNKCKFVLFFIYIPEGPIS